MYLSSVALTNVGRKRDHNEDFITDFKPSEENEIKLSGSLFIVADGVGGASQGEKASKYAAEKVLYEYYNHPEELPQDRLRHLIQAAGNQINSYAEEGENFMRMATTMVAAVFLDDALIVANVGDSRAYLIRQGVANQITKDHSFVGEMVRDGFMTEEEARVSKKKNRITRSLGGERDVRVDIFDGIALADGDKILLCSDGFSQYATKEIIVTLAQNGTSEEIATRMVAHANAHGGSDNISVILIKVSESPLEETLSMPAGEIGRPDVPSDWDDAKDTDPGEGKQPDFISKFNNLDMKVKIALGALSFLLFSLGVVLILAFSFSEHISKTISAPPSTPSEVFLTPSATGTTPPTYTPIVPTPSEDTTDTIAPASCQYKYNRDQSVASLSVLLEEVFNKSWSKEYSDEIKCPPENNESGIVCGYHKEDPGTFKIEWTLIYPDIPVDTCGEEGGTPVNAQGTPIPIPIPTKTNTPD